MTDFLYIYFYISTKSAPSYDYYHVYQKQFIQQYALHCFYTYAFCIESRDSETFIFSQNSGSFYNIYNCVPKYNFRNRNFNLKFNSPVKFRLTPNILKFITPTGLNGPFMSAFNTISKSIEENLFPLLAYINIYEQENLFISFCSQNRLQADKDIPDEESVQLQKEIRQIGDKNQERIFKRVYYILLRLLNLIQNHII